MSGSSESMWIMDVLNVRLPSLSASLGLEKFTFGHGVDVVYRQWTSPWWWSLAGAVYIPLLLLGQRYMKNRPPAKRLEWPLFIWNVLLSLYSGVSAMYAVPYALTMLRNHSLQDAVCDTSYFDTPAGFFVFVFNISKLVEWVDTVFLILRKKPIGFLHWFHHLVTYLYCFHGQFFNIYVDGGGLYFSSMNVLVHWIMYGYWAVASMRGCGAIKRYGFVVTCMQFAQMVAGLTVAILITQCARTQEENWYGMMFAILMYVVYLVEFFKVLINKLSSRSPAPKPSKPVAAGKKIQ